MNFAALLGVLAAAAFALPLVVRGGEALGLSRGLGVAVSLALALGLAATWALRQRADRPGRPSQGRGPVRTAARVRRTAKAPSVAGASQRSEVEEAVDASL